MTNAEMKAALKEAGVKDAEIKKMAKKIDAEKVTAVVEAAKNADEAIKAIGKLYPSIDIKAVKKDFDFYAGQIQNAGKEKKSKTPIALTESELEHVAGGSSVGDWFSKNWKGLLVGIAVCVAFVGGVAATAALAGGSEMVTGLLFATTNLQGIGGAILAMGVAIGATSGYVTQQLVFDKQ